MRLLLPFLLCLRLSAATYYVDFDAGSDAAAGTSTGTAWKHCHDDANAGGLAASTHLAAGDTIAFKGGVIYRGRIDPAHAGTAGSPITYKGDLWGTGRAIIDGSDVITNWLACTNAAQIGGNANWASIYVATVPTVSRWLTNKAALCINPFQDDRPLSCSQTTPSPNEWYPVTTNYYHTTNANLTTTSLTDTRLEDMGGSNLVGSYVTLWSSDNTMVYRRILTYVVGTTSITFNAFSKFSGLPDTRWAILNFPSNSVFSAPGQYYFDETNSLLYVYPWDGVNLSIAGTVTVSVRPYGFGIGAGYLTFDALKMRYFSSDDTQDGTLGTVGCAMRKSAVTFYSGLTVTNCELTGIFGLYEGAGLLLPAIWSSRIVNNWFHDGRTHTRGMQLGGTNVLVSGNTISNWAGTAIYLERSTNGTICGNNIFNCLGMHANGISPYVYCDYITISSNISVDSNIGITFENAGNLRIVDNIVDRRGSALDKRNPADATAQCLGGWGGGWGTNWLFNNIFVGSVDHNSLYCDVSTDAAGTTYVLVNNILDGGGVVDQTDSYREQAGTITRSNNVYCGLSFYNVSPWTLGANEVFQPNTNAIFATYPTDLRSAVGSPAIDRGADLSAYGFTTDILGDARGATWDIGAYEYGSSPPMPPSTRTLRAARLRAGTIRGVAP